MQTFLRFLLAVYLGHLLGDFVFQSRSLVHRKQAGKPSGYLVHGIVHYLSAAGVVGFFLPGSILSVRTHLIVIGLTLAHLLIDFIKINLTKRAIPDNWAAYVADQLLHLATIVVAAWLLAPGLPLSAMMQAWQGVRLVRGGVLAVPIVYIVVVFGGGYLIRYLTRSLAEGIRDHSPERSSEQLQNAGLYIGWLERFLVVTALLLQSPAMVGLILTAKSIARYPELKSERFAEYFLIGTLLSVGIALLGGALLSKILFGQVRMGG